MSDKRENPGTVDMHYLASVLEGVRFPARRWQLIAWASYNAAGLRLVDALQTMPEIDYRSVGHVARELHEGGADWW